ncbi:MAG: 30S ribosomal protein S20 [Gemmatimonadota bacterium]
MTYTAVSAYASGLSITGVRVGVSTLVRISFVPRIASAKKNMRKARAATARNRSQRATLRTALKKAKAPGAESATRRDAVILLDRAARKGLIHKNTAARQKSRMAKKAAT